MNPAADENELQNRLQSWTFERPQQSPALPPPTHTASIEFRPYLRAGSGSSCRRPAPTPAVTSIQSTPLPYIASAANCLWSSHSGNHQKESVRGAMRATPVTNRASHHRGTTAANASTVTRYQGQGWLMAEKTMALMIAKAARAMVSKLGSRNAAHVA